MLPSPDIVGLASTVISAAGPQVAAARDELDTIYLDADPAVAAAALEEQLRGEMVDGGTDPGSIDDAFDRLPLNPTERRDALLAMAALLVVLKNNHMADTLT